MDRREKTIRELRVKAKLTMEQCANAIGLTYETYRSREANPLKFTLEQFLALCYLFNVQSQSVDIFETQRTATIKVPDSSVSNRSQTLICKALHERMLKS